MHSATTAPASSPRASRAATSIVALVLTLLLAALALVAPTPAYAAPLSVTTCADTGVGSLPVVFAAAGLGDTITFAVDCPTATPITLTSTLTPGVNVTIDATAPLHTVTISGGGKVQLFVVNSGVTLSLTGLTLANGNTATSGGAIFNNFGGTVNVTNSTFSGNSALNGGAISNSDTVNVTNSTFSGNTATSGGAIFNNVGTVNVTGSTFSGNYATNSGGAIYNSDTVTVNVTNSTFSGNTAPAGGVIINFGTATVTGSTFSGNSAALNGGAIANTFTSMLTFALSLSTVSGNTAGSNGPDIAGRVTSGGGNVIGDTSAASGFIASDKLNTDPKLAPLALNAPGTTQTFALLPGSPALDIAACPTDPITTLTLATDARGVGRPQGAKCDSGSYESRGFTAGSPTGNNQSAPVTTAFTSPVGLTVSSASTEPVAGGQVTFTITAAMVGGASATFPAAGSCTLTSATVAVCPIGINGTVASPPFAANSVLGPFTILATGAGISGATTFSETVTAGPATSFAVSGFPSPMVAGVSGNVTVTAKDALGNTATGYTGIVAITSSDAAAVLPANAILTNGVGSFRVTLKTAGMGRSITATDTVTTSITGAQTGIVVNPGAAATFTVSGFPSPTTSGVAGTVTVTAKDAFANIATGYTGTVRITSSDTAAVLPANATLTNGVGTFAVTLKTVGTQSITATDTLTASITGAQTGITVTAPTVTSLTTTAPTGSGSGNSGTASSPTLRAGGSFTLTTTARYSNSTSGTPANLTYTGYDATRISVDANGVVTALAPGTTTITLTAPDGKGGTVMTAITVTVTGGSGGGLMNPNPQPGVKAGSTAAPDVTVAPQPMHRPDGTGSTGGGVQPQAAGATGTPAATPQVQPARH